MHMSNAQERIRDEPRGDCFSFDCRHFDVRHRRNPPRKHYTHAGIRPKPLCSKSRHSCCAMNRVMYRVHGRLLTAAGWRNEVLLPCADDTPPRCYGARETGVNPAKNPTILGPDSTHFREYRGQVKAKRRSAILNDGLVY